MSRALHRGYGESDAARSRASPGPIAIIPTSAASFDAAVARGGGQLQPLSPATRGIVWTSSGGQADLESALEGHPDVSWVQLPWAGVDAFAGLLERYRDDGRVWTSAKGAYGQPVAEHALALTLALLRQLPRRIRAGRWHADELGRTLFGSSVVIVGAGGIARALIELLVPFGVRTTVVRRRVDAVDGADRTVKIGGLGDAVSEADVVVVAAAHTASTRGVIDAAMLERMPRHAIVVNVARGALVDTNALDTALRAGSIGGAGLDVTDPEPLPAEHPLWGAPNCIITPHVADTIEMTEPLFAERIERNVRALVNGTPFVGRIDLDAGY